jgi:hypothetical protein
MTVRSFVNTVLNFLDNFKIFISFFFFFSENEFPNFPPKLVKRADRPPRARYPRYNFFPLYLEATTNTPVFAPFFSLVQYLQVRLQPIRAEHPTVSDSKRVVVSPRSKRSGFVFTTLHFLHNLQIGPMS